ncbi:MAG TPA: toll/interleukin-1 receptor domain-containing protein [Thermoanaerobaculia bacterium]|jgi:hypothetical protein|nr:toll/interleukin-1 receptor domain-containing protein [Thermoanaerobaculia bacterium]
MQKLQTYFGVRAILMSDLDPARLDLLLEKVEAIRRRYDFNPDEFHLYLHTLRIWAEDSHFGLAGGLSRRLKNLTLTFGVNPKQRSSGDIKLLNDETESDLSAGVTLSTHPYEVTFTFDGSFFENRLDFRNELITFVRKTVSPEHRKIKAAVRAEPTPAFAERLRERNLQILSKFDSYLTRPVQLKAPALAYSGKAPMSFDVGAEITEAALENPMRGVELLGSDWGNEGGGGNGGNGNGGDHQPVAARNRIFISYKHAASNKKVLDRLLFQLYDLEKKGLIDAWSDRKIEAGMIWPPEIEKALSSATVAVLLVSVEFMASPFIREKELPVLLERAGRQQVTILPLILDAAILWTEEPKFSAFQSVNPPEKPLLKMSIPKRDEYLADTARRIKALLESRNPPA